MDHADPGIVTAGTEESDAVRDETGTAGDFDDDVGSVGGDLWLGGVEDWDPAHGWDEQETFGIAIDHDDPAPSGGMKEGAAIEAEETGALKDHGVLWGREIPEDGDHGGECAIGGRGHGVGDAVRNGNDGGAGAKNDVGGVTTVESRAVGERGVTVLEEVIAFLGKVPTRARGALPATVSQGPGDSRSDQGGVTTFADGQNPAHGFVAEDAGGGAVSTPGKGVEVGSANGGEGDLHEAFAGAGEVDGG